MWPKMVEVNFEHLVEPVREPINGGSTPGHTDKIIVTSTYTVVPANMPRLLNEKERVFFYLA